MDHLHERLKRLEQRTHAVERQLRWWRGLLARGLRSRRDHTRDQITRHTSGLHWMLTIGLVLAWITAAAGQPIGCGDTLGPGGVFQLQADLFCDDAIALTVRDGALLDLGGHTVSATEIAILLDGRGALLQNGTAVTGGLAPIRVAGGGWHTVRGIDTTPGSQSQGIVVVSDHNRVLSNSSSSFETGFRIDGNYNVLAGNMGSGQCVVVVTGHQNLLIKNDGPEFLRCGYLIPWNKNLLVGNQSTLADEGFLVSGDGNILVGNIVTRSGSGIVISGQKNIIVRNTAQDNGIDLVDTHEDCDGNVWQRNVFRTSQAGSIETPACIR